MRAYLATTLLALAATLGVASPSSAQGLPPLSSREPHDDVNGEPPGRPLVLPWREDGVIPPGYHEGKRFSTGMVISGSVVFGTAWVPSLVVGSLIPEGSIVVGYPKVALWPMAVPLVGPFVAAVNAVPAGEGHFVAAFLVLDGLQQAVGLAVLIAGLVPRRVLLRGEPAQAKAWWAPVPLPLGRGGVGLGFVGAM